MGAPGALRRSSRTSTRSLAHPSLTSTTSMPRCCQKRFVRARSRATASRSSATAGGPAEAVASIRGAPLAAALGGRAPAATARRLDEEHVAGTHGDADLFRLQHAWRLAAREQPVTMRQAVLAAEDS